jgi:hypothetical protein
MIKKIICFMALLLLAAPLFAQFRIGVKGGGNKSNLLRNMNGVKMEIYEPRMGIHGGVMAEYMFTPRFGLHSELLYFYSGATIVPEKYRRLYYPQWPYVESSLDGYMDMYLFQLPVYAKAKFALGRNVKLYVMGGGFVSFAVSGNQNVRDLSYSDYGSLGKHKWSLYEPYVRGMDYECLSDHLQQRWNVGLAAETGVEIMDGLTLGVGFRPVLNNMSAYGRLTGRNTFTTKMWTATVSAGYFF